MRLPQREYYTVHEVATRWGCTIADIAGWSSKGRLDIVTGVPPVICGSDLIAGEVVVSAFDILPMFRRCGTGPQSAFVRRVRANGSSDWSSDHRPRGGRRGLDRGSVDHGPAGPEVRGRPRADAADRGRRGLDLAL